MHILLVDFDVPGREVVNQESSRVHINWVFSRSFSSGRAGGGSATITTKVTSIS